MSAEDNPFAKGNYKPSVQGGHLEGLVSPDVQALLDRVALAQEEANPRSTGSAVASPSTPLTAEEREISAAIDAAMASDNKSTAIEPESAAAAALAAARASAGASAAPHAPSVASDEPKPSPAVVTCCPPESAPYLAATENYTPLGEVVDVAGGVPCYATGSSEGALRTAIIAVPDVWGFNGGRVRAIADEIARALDATVLVPMLLQPALEGGTDGDGLPPDFDIGERGDEFVPWIRGIAWSEGEHAVAPKIQAVLDYAMQRGAAKIAMVGFCWGGWVVCKTSAMTPAVLCGVIAHPSAHIEAQIHGGDNDAMSSAVQAPLLLLPASNDPNDYHSGGAIFSKLPAGSETHTYQDMVHGWATRGDVVADPDVARDTRDAIGRMIKFLAVKLEAGAVPAPATVGEDAAQVPSPVPLPAPAPAPAPAQARLSENSENSESGDVRGVAARAAEAMLREQAAATALASASSPTFVTTQGTAGTPVDDSADAVRQMLESAAADPASIAVVLPSEVEAAEQQRKAAGAIQLAHDLLDKKELEQSLSVLDSALAEFGDSEAHVAPPSGASQQEALLAAGVYTTVRTLHANRAAVLQEMKRNGIACADTTLMAAFDGAEQAASLEANALVSASQSEAGHGTATETSITDMERALMLARHELAFNYAEALRGAARWDDAINKYLAVEAARAAGADVTPLPGDVQLRAGYAKTACFVELGRFDEGLQSAASALQEASAVNAASADVLARLNAQKAFCLLQLQQFEESLEILDELVNTGHVATDDQERVIGWRAHAQAELGKQYVAEDRHNEALELLDQAVVHLPMDPTVHYSRGLALSHKSELDGAAAAFGRVFTSPTGGASFEHANDVHVALGNILLLQSAFSEAVPHFEAAAVALDASPGTAPTGGMITVAPPTTVWLHLGLARVRSQAAASSARQAFEKALSCDKDNLEARAALDTLNAEADAGEASVETAQPNPTHSEGSAKIDIARREHTQQLAAQQQERAAAADRAAQEQADADATNLARAIFPYERLVQADAPPGVDPAQKEQYLSDAEFEQYFGTTRDAFGKLPGWKRKKQKQAVGLF